jgi:UDP-2,4-diacetamido-2,4,6-trideoxy-beta-L-altropyranose hydrolase
LTRRVCIRVDGNSEIGLGHIVRSIALSQMLSEIFLIHFYSKFIPESLKVKIQSLEFGFSLINEESDFIENIKESDIVVFDGYNFDFSYQKLIKEKGNKLVVIDDMCKDRFYTDLIINHSPGILKSNYITEGKTDFALGLKYCLLRPPFLTALQSNNQIRKNNSIVITFGGSDFQGVTIRVLKIILGNNIHFSDINVVVGPSFPYNNELQKLIVNSSIKINLFSSLDEYEMCDLFLKNQYAIVPSSGVLFESLACGCIPISGFYTDNQFFAYQSFLKMNLFVDAYNFSEDKILTAIKNLSAENINLERKIFDEKIEKKIRVKFSKL